VHRSFVAAPGSAPAPRYPSFTKARAEDLRHRPGRLPPVALRGQIRQAPLMRFGFALQRLPAAPFRPEVAGFRTIPLRRFSDPGTHAVNRLVPAVFSASRLGYRLFRSSKTPPARVIRGRIRCHPRTGPTPGCYRGLAGIVVIRFRRRSWVFLPFAVSLRFPGERVFQRLGPTCRFAFRPPRVSSSRDPPLTADHGFLAAASGLLPRKPAVPCDLPTPL
jgi:hypothetical protein